MNFVHDDPEFVALLRQVSAETGIDAGLIEKDYWITHSLWALHSTELAIWFKGGTSLSKGFGLIERFSEDLDLMIERGGVTNLPEVPNWMSTNAGPTAERRAFFEKLPAVMAIPGVSLQRDVSRQDAQARAADYIGRYTGAFNAGLPSVMSPFIRFEVGRARVVPCVPMPITSFVHQYLEQLGLRGDYVDNRPLHVRCVHPLVTLLEKLDAISRRYKRSAFEANGFVRHYEDAARIIRVIDQLPPVDITAVVLAKEMLSDKSITSLPRADDPSLVLAEPEKRERVERAYAMIAPMFWGPRIPLHDACATIRAWVGTLHT
jgi:hypothetical protein